MRNDTDFFKRDIELNKSAEGICITSIYISMTILVIVTFVKTGEIPYDLFCIFFISEFSKAAYKYSKNKSNLYLVEAIGCMVAIISLLILIL